MSGFARLSGGIIESSVLIASEVSLSNGVAADVTSLTLTPGDWEVWGTVSWDMNGATTSTNAFSWISLTSATLPTKATHGAISQIGGQTFTAALPQVPLGPVRFSVTVNTLVYLGVFANFGTNTLKAYGYLAARPAL